MALYLQPGTNVEQTIEALRAGYPNARDYTFYSNRALRDVVVDLFNQTFAVTQVLRVVAVLVAVIGIALNFTVLVKEREREIGTMQAVGVSRRQICGLIIWESLLVGIAALLLGLATGGALSVVLTEVINKAFFGWTIPLQIPWAQILVTPIWLLPAAALASLWPANQASRAEHNRLHQDGCMKKVICCCLAMFLVAATVSAEKTNDQGWAVAVPGYQITFPRDHFPHYQFRTEWWYFTGNLKTTDGRAFGYQVTFFRHGYRPPGNREPVTSRFVMNDVKFAHFAVTDVSSGKFYFDSRVSRGAFGEAGFGDGKRLAWIDNWELDFDGDFRLKAATKDYAVELDLTPEKPRGAAGRRWSESKG